MAVNLLKWSVALRSGPTPNFFFDINSLSDTLGAVGTRRGFSPLEGVSVCRILHALQLFIPEIPFKIFGKFDSF